MAKELKVDKNGHILNGWIPQEKDARDYQYLQIGKIKVWIKKTDLRPGCSPIEDQEQEGSCVYQASIGALEFLEIMNHVPFVDKSRQFAYYCGRADNGNVNEDTGDTIRHAMKILANFGTCDEKLWPYKMDNFAIKPTPECYADAKKHVITSYYALKNIDEIRQCLTEGFPIVFGTLLFPQFEIVGKDGIVKMPTCWKKPIGGHGMVFVGHDDDTEYLTTRNSWTDKWGDKGYCYIPYKYVEKYASDFWSIRIEK